MHFKQVYTSKVYQDKIYAKLKEDKVRDKILRGELEEDGYEYEEIYEFLKLLARNINYNITTNSEEISTMECDCIVKKIERTSALSMFSHQIYSMHKCTLESNKMTNILVLFYTTIIRKGIYSQC